MINNRLKPQNASHENGKSILIEKRSAKVSCATSVEINERARTRRRGPNEAGRAKQSSLCFMITKNSSINS